MSRICETCGVENPVSNRFCGQCGRQLERTAADTPEEFWRDIGIRSQPSTTEFLQWLDNTTATPISAANPPAREAAEPNTTDSLSNSQPDPRTIAIQPTPNSQPRPLLQSSPPASSSRTGVSGPSFLGLTDDPVSDEIYYEELEPRSHLRRYIALGITAAALLLASLQWRSIRDYGLAYVQSGTMEVKKRDAQTPRNPPAVAADNTSRDLGLPPATAANSSAPQQVESSPNTNHPLSVQQAANSTPPPAASPAPNSANQPPASMAAPTADLPASQSPAKRAANSKPRPFSRSVTESSAAGADEMNRATRASDPEARAAWLWKAVSKGNRQAPVELARMYEQGNGVVRSCDQAQVLLRSAAARGNQEAKLNLRQILLRGGCPSR